MPSEDELLQMLHRALGSAAMVGGDLVVGIGDDAAVLRCPEQERQLVATVDMLVEGQHFVLRPGAFAAADVGWKALAVNLSDIAAMGALPRWALCSLALPADRREAVLPSLYRGLGRLAGAFGVRVVGGNLASAPTLAIDVVVLGEVRRAVCRAGTTAGDRLYVTGRLGAAAAGLALMHSGQALHERYAHTLLTAQRRPRPRVREGLALAALPDGTLHAMCDISDGLARDARRLLGGLGVTIWEDALPIPDAVRWAAEVCGVDPLRWAVYGGEDYELLLTAPAAAEPSLRAAMEREGMHQLHCIGEVHGGGSYLCSQKGGTPVPLAEDGWDPFRVPEIRRQVVAGAS